MKQLLAPLLALALLLSAFPAFAADLGDPTRPPAGFSEQPKAADAPKEAPLQVSSVFLMGSKPYAVVDGQVVRVGDKLEAGQVVRINESGVWLKTPSGPRQLKLLPDVIKTPVGKTKVEQR
jgi:hypothetical protein